jgi:hypothetical protein
MVGGLPPAHQVAKGAREHVLGCVSGKRSDDAGPGSPRGRWRGGQKGRGLPRTGSRWWTGSGARDLQPGEPHDRFQGATNLKCAWWSKPSQPGGTARAERVRKVAAPDRRWLRAAPRISSETRYAAALRSSGTTGSGHQAQVPMEGRIYDNPTRGAQVQRGEPWQAIWPARFCGAGQRAAQTGLRLRRRGEGHEGPAIGRPDPKARTSEKSLADPFRLPNVKKVKEGAWRRPTIHNPLERWQHRAAALVAVAKRSTALKVPPTPGRPPKPSGRGRPVRGSTL